jgi:hypothetical protein
MIPLELPHSVPCEAICLFQSHLTHETTPITFYDQHYLNNGNGNGNEERLLLLQKQNAPKKSK